MRSATSPATPVTATPGPPTSTPKPAPNSTTTPTPSASWPAPGSTSSGAAGRTTPSTTRPTTAPCKGSSIKINNQWQLDTGQLIGYLQNPSRRCGPSARPSAPSLAGRCPSDLDLLLIDLGLVHRLHLGLPAEYDALGRGERVGELGEACDQRLFRLIRQVALRPDRLQRGARCVPQVLEVLALEPPDVLHRHPVQVTAGARPDGDDLLLHRIRRELALLEQFDQPRPAGQGLLGRRVQVGAEGREGLQLAIGRQVETQRAGDLPHGFDLGGAADPGDRDADVDGRPDAGIEQVTLEEALAIGDRDDVGRDVGRYLSLIHI